MNLNSAYTQTKSSLLSVESINHSSKLNSNFRNPFLRRVVPIKKVLSFEEKIMEEATSFIIENLENPNYRITNLSQDLAYSQRQLERIIKKMTGLSPVAYVREIRLQEAYRLLKSGVYQTISEVRFEVGIEHPSYFKRKFIERFGVSPVEVKGRF